MDTEEEVGRLKWLLIGGLVFLVSGCFSVGEMKYKMGAKEADAKVVSTQEVQERGRRGRVRNKLEVEYVFKDEKGSAYKGKQRVDDDSPIREGQTIRIEYLADKSRIKGEDNMFWVYVFLASVAFVVFKIVMIWRQSKA